MTSSETTFNDEELIDYTDPDTIARQNIAPNAGCNIDGKFYDVRNLVHLASSQADRIEALEAKLATCEKYRDAYDEMGRIGTQAVRDLEAKLARAVEALSDLMMHEPDHPDTIWEKARATLAEISSHNKGESHD